MREVISLHIGGAGVRLGASCWELYCLEHGIALDGSLPVPPDDSHAFNTFFDEREEGDRWTPRAILIDNQADAIEQLRAGELRQLFDPQLIVSGSCGSGSTSRSNAEASPSSFVSAHGRALVDASLDRIRQLAEDCTGLQGFLLFHSAGGGAGSGLSSLLLESLADEFDAKTRISFPIYSKQEQDHPISAPDAYNPVLAGHAMLEHADVTVPFDNSTLHRICKTTLDLQSPTPKDYNSLLAPVLSTLTSSLRYSGLLHSDLEQIVRNLVTRPRFSTIIASYSGFHSAERVLYNTPSILDLTEDCFASRGALVECDLGAPSVRHLAHPCLMHRGDVVPKDVNNAVRAVKGKGGLKFVDWTPEGFKPGICFSPPPHVPWPRGRLAKMQRVLCSLSNSTAIQQLFARVTTAFDEHWRRKDDWAAYSAMGLESTALDEAREDLAALQSEYATLSAEMKTAAD